MQAFFDLNRASVVQSLEISTVDTIPQWRFNPCAKIPWRNGALTPRFFVFFPARKFNRRCRHSRTRANISPGPPPTDKNWQHFGKNLVLPRIYYNLTLIGDASNATREPVEWSTLEIRASRLKSPRVDVQKACN